MCVHIRHSQESPTCFDAHTGVLPATGRFQPLPQRRDLVKHFHLRASARRRRRYPELRLGSDTHYQRHVSRQRSAAWQIHLGAALPDARIAAPNHSRVLGLLYSSLNVGALEPDSGERCARGIVDRVLLFWPR